MGGSCDENYNDNDPYVANAYDIQDYDAMTTIVMVIIMIIMTARMVVGDEMVAEPTYNLIKTSN